MNLNYIRLISIDGVKKTKSQAVNKNLVELCLKNEGTLTFILNLTFNL